MNSLTEQQQQIVSSIGKSTSVSAGAGTGKTHVMVERCLAIITGDAVAPELRASVREILVLTFTDDAAAELRIRLVERLTSLGLLEERRSVETAYISTIHHFCSRLLKENPFEAGVDPAFGVLDDSQNTLLLDEAFEMVLQEGLRHAWAEVTELCGEYAAHQPPEGCDNAAGHLKREASTAMEALRCRGWTPERLREWIRRGHDAFVEANLLALRSRLDALRNEASPLIDQLRLLDLGIDCSAENARATIISVDDAWPENAANSPRDDVRRRCSLLNEMRSACGKTAGKKEADANRLAALQEHLRKLRTVLDPARAYQKCLDSECEDESARRAVRFLKLTYRLWMQHTALKSRRSLLDFGDLQLLARDLLVSCAHIRDRYRSQFKQILVDEFQDTDSLQAEIIRLICRESNLCCVGDPKQSIYGFRNADLQIFRGLVEQFRTGPTERATHLDLSHNFRCRSEIVSVVNQIFSRIGCGDSVDYEPLVCAASFAPALQPRVEILLAPEASKAEKEGAPLRTADLAEARLVASRISEMLDDDSWRITAAGDRCGERLRPRDFLVLLRTFTALPAYEQALREQDLDHYVVGGRGYFARQEIRDAANLLKVISSPIDDIALAAVLRSPFCNLSDDALYVLAQLGRSEQRSSGELKPCLLRGLREALRSISASPSAETSAGASTAPLPPEDRLRLREFWTLVERLRREQDRRSVAGLLEVALQESLYEARLLMQPSGRRRVANVRKLVVMAGALPGCSIPAFLAQIDELSRLQEREGEAPTDEESADVVRIRTIHSSKGLQANVVIVAGVGKTPLFRGGYRPCVRLDPTSGAAAAQVLLSKGPTASDSATFAALEEAQKQREMGESLRLLYVAATRAREALIFAGAVPLSPSGWGSRILEALGIAPGAEPREQIRIGPTLEVLVSSSPFSSPSPTGSHQLRVIQQCMRSGLPIDPLLLQAFGESPHPANLS